MRRTKAGAVGPVVAAVVLAALAHRAAPSTTPEQLLVPGDAAAGSRFGYAVAADGDVLVVGAPGANAAYVFRATAGVWAEEAKLTADASVDFGYAVAVDGDTVLVGDPGFLDHRGLVSVFRRTGGVWAREDTLLSPVFDAWEVFGDAVAVSGDTAMVGAPLAGDYDTGAVHTFARTGATWWLQAEPAGVPGGAMGSAVVLAGSTAAWGSPWTGHVCILDRVDGVWSVTGALGGSAGYHDTQDMGLAIDAGTFVVADPWATRVSRRVGSGWVEEAALAGASSVSLEGDWLLAGADDAAHLYRRDAGAWSLRATLSAPGAGGAERADGSVALEGGRAFVGAPRRDASAGAVLVFDLDFPKAEVAPLDLVFERTAALFAAPEQFVTVRNVGDADLHVASVSVTGDGAAAFTVAPGGPAPAPSTSPTLAPGAAVTFAVGFAPAAEGEWVASLRVASDDPGDDAIDVALRGSSARCVAAPDAGTLGTVVSVTGAGLGTRKGRLRLLGGKRPSALRVTRWNEGGDGLVLGVVVRPLPAGEYHVGVAPRGAEELVDPVPFTVVAPSFVGIEPSGGVKGTEVALTGTALGTVKGRVWLQAPGATKRIKCKVIAWPHDAASGTGAGEARFLVPKGLAAGTVYDVVVRNGIGESRGVGAFTAEP